jgi:hypothetical protein
MNLSGEQIGRMVLFHHRSPISPWGNGSQCIQFKKNTIPDELWQCQCYRLTHREMDIAYI